MTRMLRLVLPSTALLAVLLALAPATRAEETEAVELAQALLDLTTLKAQLNKGKTPNEDILGSLDAVFKGYKKLKEPEAPAADASEDVKKAHDVAMAKFQRDSADFRKQAEDAFLDALTVQRINQQTESNEREDVNIAAARILAETGNPKLSSKIVTAVDSRLMKAKYQVTTGLWEAAFAALGKLGDEKSLAWIHKNFMHTRNSPPEVVDQLVAAHKSIPLYAEIPSRIRFDLAKEMITQYMGVESQAEQKSTDKNVQAAKVFWDRIKTDVIKAVQFLAKEPANAEGQALATMKEFQAWMRDHENPRKAPWVDEKPAEENGGKQ